MGAGTLTYARRLHTATLLLNGKVLVVGGDAANALATAELYDPVSGTWTTVGAGTLTYARRAHTATLLSNGTVLVAAGPGRLFATLEQHRTLRSERRNLEDHGGPFHCLL